MPEPSSSQVPHSHREALWALGGFAATELGGFAIAAALERAGIEPDQVDYVFMGQVILAGGQITAARLRPRPEFRWMSPPPPSTRCASPVSTRYTSPT